MDAIRGYFMWPFFVVKEYTLLFFGATIISVPLIARRIEKGSLALNTFVDLFSFLSKYPLGNRVLSGIVGFVTPYTSSIHPTIRKLETHGDMIESEVSMEDLPWLRNPFGSVHALALGNLGEMSSGLCVISALQMLDGSVKGIPVRIDTQYFKKARGRLTAATQISLRDFQLEEDKDNLREFVASILDRKGVQVARCSVFWSLKKGLEKQKENSKNKADGSKKEE